MIFITLMTHYYIHIYTNRMTDHNNQLKPHNVNYLDSSDDNQEEEEEDVAKQEENSQGDQVEKSTKHCISNRRTSVNLLDMTEFPSVQPNIINQKQSRDSLHENNKNNVNLLDKDSKNDYSKSLTTSLQKFDPLQKSTKQPSSSVIDAIAIDSKSTTKTMPTRLPTPRRPVNYTHQSADNIHTITNTTTNNHPPIIATTTAVSTASSIQLGPTPPSSPGRRVRHTSIARLVKPIPRELGKANRELAEFDPLISPVRDSKVMPVIDGSKEDLLTLSPTITSKKGAHHVNIKRGGGERGEYQKAKLKLMRLSFSFSHTHLYICLT